MERYGDTGQYYNWYDHRTGAKLTDWPPEPRARSSTRSCPRSTTAGSPSACGSSRTASRELARARRRALRRDGLRLLLPARRQPRALPLPARRPGGVALLLRHRRQREPDRRLHRHRPRAAAAEGVLRALAHVPRHLRLDLAGDQAGRRLAPLLRRRRLRGRLPLRRHRARAVVGREHVRGADARAVRARGALGAAQLGRQPPAHRAGADPPRPDARPATATGASRRRTSPRAATAPAASTAPAWTPTACRPTRTTRSSTTASPAAPTAPPSPTRRRRPTRTASSRRTPRSSRCATRRARRSANLRRARARLPGPVRQVGLPRQRQRPDGARLGRLPVARPGDDHGRARQRARRRRAAPRLRRPRRSSGRCAR